MTAITFSARNITTAAEATSQCLVFPVFKGEKLKGLAQEVDALTAGAIEKGIAMGDFEARGNETLLVPGTGSIKRILLVGCGERKNFDQHAGRTFCQHLATAIGNTKAADALLHLDALGLGEEDARSLLTFLARHLTTSSYRYTQTLSKPKPPAKLRRLVVNAGTTLATKGAGRALQLGAATGSGLNEARELANLPGNICTPAYLARHARKLARDEARISVSVLDEKKMRELGMGALLSVSAGSEQPAKLIVMHYKGGKAKEKPYVLVGKGITFDTGGISLKPGAKMDEMKFDMGGAASVFGTLRSVADLGLRLNVIGVVAAAENMPSGTATKPGDVVTSMSGQTIEVLNTDAEGRLVLCDALTYVERFKPAAVIDIATLTGACVVALGAHASGLFSGDDELAEQLLSAGTESHDRAWRMPLWDEYAKQLKSNFADVANIGGPSAGSITAACFLARFTKKYRWAHLDIAGSAWDSAPKGATGRPVALLTRYLLDRAG